MNDFSEYNSWRENFLGTFRQISTDEDFKRLASFYPYNDYTDNKCKQRKNNLLRSGNRNVYLDDLYAVSKFSDKINLSPACLKIGIECLITKDDI